MLGATDDDHHDGIVNIAVVSTSQGFSFGAFQTFQAKDVFLTPSCRGSRLQQPICKW